MSIDNGVIFEETLEQLEADMATPSTAIAERPAPVEGILKPGHRFAGTRWTVVEIGGSRRGRRVAVCRCDCGTERAVRLDAIARGTTKSCGCLAAEMSSERERTHGMSGANETREYRIWAGILTRCRNQNDDHWPSYGGRGITVCDRWLKFENFLEDMGISPPGTSFDRIDNDGNYEPGNCRWATATEQGRNTRSNRMLTHDGRTLCVAEWSEITGIDCNVLFARLRSGWSHGRTLTQPVEIQQTGMTNERTRR